jgi:hypothetical protein
MTGRKNGRSDKWQVGQIAGWINDAFYVKVGQMTHIMYWSNKCGGRTNVVVGQMSGRTNFGRTNVGWTNVGWTNVGRTNIGRTKVAAPIGGFI